jgi:hypothetical protein
MKRPTPIARPWNTKTKQQFLELAGLEVASAEQVDKELGRNSVQEG